ncbi:MAG TPA: response regulator [Nitrososphaeraceae archaeon]|nr:response regulator [Nitrososphaeraceae archaeon]
MLLVDDEDDILNLFCDCLQAVGYNIVFFDNPLEALNYLNRDENIITNCSLVITDYRMPQMSGIDLIEKIREKDTNCKVKIILSSAFIKRDLILDNTKINSLSIDKIIEKPIRLEILKDEVQKLVRATPLSK